VSGDCIVAGLAVSDASGCDVRVKITKEYAKHLALSADLDPNALPGVLVDLIILLGATGDEP
jgi:hypothetical protein